MTWPLTEIGMIGAGISYVICAIGWAKDGHWWMAATFGLYTLTALTLYLAGRH